MSTSVHHMAGRYSRTVELGRPAFRSLDHLGQVFLSPCDPVCKMGVKGLLEKMLENQMKFTSTSATPLALFCFSATWVSFSTPTPFPNRTWASHFYSPFLFSVRVFLPSDSLSVGISDPSEWMIRIDPSELIRRIHILHNYLAIILAQLVPLTEQQRFLPIVAF